VTPVSYGRGKESRSTSATSQAFVAMIGETKRRDRRKSVRRGLSESRFWALTPVSSAPLAPVWLATSGRGQTLAPREFFGARQEGNSGKQGDSLVSANQGMRGLSYFRWTLFKAAAAASRTPSSLSSSTADNAGAASLP